jgi:hypothetical protein
VGVQNGEDDGDQKNHHQPAEGEILDQSKRLDALFGYRAVDLQCVCSHAAVLESIEVNSGSFKAAPKKPPLGVKVSVAGADIPVIGKGRRDSGRTLPAAPHSSIPHGRMPMSVNYKNLTVCRRKGTDIGTRRTNGDLADRRPGPLPVLTF